MKRFYYFIFIIFLLPNFVFARNVDDVTIHTARLEARGVDSYSCKIKKTCKQMGSCREAKYYFIECGFTRLDGDKDGVPCEDICN